jgi:hypothetical protein
MQHATCNMPPPTIVAGCGLQSHVRRIRQSAHSKPNDCWGCPEILLGGFRSAQIARAKSEPRALTKLPRPRKLSAKTLLSGYSFTELRIRVRQDFCTSIYIRVKISAGSDGRRWLTRFDTRSEVIKLYPCSG